MRRKARTPTFTLSAKSRERVERLLLEKPGCSVLLEDGSIAYISPQVYADDPDQWPQQLKRVIDNWPLPARAFVQHFGKPPETLAKAILWWQSFKGKPGDLSPRPGPDANRPGPNDKPKAKP